jgi:HK97 family phage major capsid protein
MNSQELKNQKLDILQKIEKMAEESKPDFDAINSLRTDIAGIEKMIEIKVEIEKATADRIEAEKKLSPAIAKSVAGSGASKSEEKEEGKIFEKFSIYKSLQQIKNKESLSGAEAEVYAIAQKEANDIGLEVIGNIAIPQKMINFPGKKKAVTVGTEGANIVDTDFGAKIPLLEIDPAVIRAGARVFTGLNGDVQFPRNATGATLNWEGEVDPAAETTPTYDNIKLIPNRLSGYIDYSIQSGLQSSFDLESDLRERLSRAYSIEWDRVALLGTGVGNEPTGIVNYVGVGVVPTATNKVTWPVALQYPATLNQANVPADGRQAYMGPAIVKADLMGTPKDAGSGLFVMNDAGMVAGMPYHMNNNLPIDGGTGSDEATMIYGRWNSLYLGQWGGMSILFDPYTQAVNGTNRLVLNAYLDVQLEHPEAFAISEDIIPG